MAGAIGRNRTLLLNDMIMIIVSGLSIATIAPIFGIGRFILCISAGISPAIAPMYISETTPQEMMKSVGPTMSILDLQLATTPDLYYPQKNLIVHLTTSGNS